MPNYTTHSKSPWFCTVKSDGYEKTKITTLTHRICELDSSSEGYFNCPTDREQEANARLMAESPNLLERCEQFLSFYRKHKADLIGLSAIADQMADTVRKAKGE